MNLKPVLRTLMFFLSAWICTSFAYAQTLLIKDGKTKVKIILKEDIQVNKVAANLFQSFFQKITSKTLPIVINQTPQKGDILIGGGDCSRSDRGWILYFHQRWYLESFR